MGIVIAILCLSAVCIFAFFLLNPRLRIMLVRLKSKKARDIYRMYPRKQKSISIKEIGAFIKWKPEEIRKIRITSWENHGIAEVKRTGKARPFNKDVFTKLDYKWLLWLLFCSDLVVEVDSY